MAGAQVLPSGGGHLLHHWERQDYLRCNGKSCISLSRSDLARVIHDCHYCDESSMVFVVVILLSTAQSDRVDLICSTQWH